MKKEFAVYCEVQLTETPDWLATFRSKYDKPYPYHLTLKQPAYIEVSDLPTINNRVTTIVHDTPFSGGSFKMTFDKLVLDEHDDYDNAGYIYLFCSKRNVALDSLQFKIRSSLKEFSNYINPSSYEYEHAFNPHITIARELDEGMFKSAVSELPDTIVCRGTVSQIVVACVPEVNPEEANNPSNLTTYSLRA